MSLKKLLKKYVIPDLSNIIIRYCNHYEITLDHRYLNMELEYLVKYPNWSSEWNEWISSDDYVDISMLSDYWKGKKKKYPKIGKKWGIKTKKHILVEIFARNPRSCRMEKTIVVHYKRSKK